MKNLAEQFKQEHKDYFFEDAHFLVEANATKVAREVAYNTFVFDDNSVLRIIPNLSVLTYPSLDVCENMMHSKSSIQYMTA